MNNDFLLGYVGSGNLIVLVEYVKVFDFIFLKIVKNVFKVLCLLHTIKIIQTYSKKSEK